MASSTAKYFGEVNGETVEFTHFDLMRNKEFAERFPGVKGKKYDGFDKLTTGGRKSTGLAGCANAYVGVFRKDIGEE